MSAADKIEAARSIVAEFDESFFAHRKQFLRDALSEMADLADAQAQEIARLKAENADLKTSVVAFGAVHAVTYAKQWGLPDGHLHPHHYDILEKAGARMVDFTRAALGDAP